HLAVLNFSVRAFDKSEFINSGITTERRNQADVRPFRSFNGADAAIVSGVDVTNLEPGPFTTQSARTQGGKPPLVGNLRERVGLVHELGELTGAKEFAHRSHDRFGINQ